MEKISPSKNELRKIFLARRDALPASTRERLSALITERLLNWPPFKQAQRLLLYASFKSEVDTYPLIKKALALEKEVYLPKTYFRPKRLRLFRLYTLGELRPGAFGIPEPPETNPELSPEKLELIVVPGVAFDRRGGRLGYGGGFYDRLFVEAKKARRVALAFSCQLTETLPLEPHDVLMHALITEKELIEFR